MNETLILSEWPDSTSIFLVFSGWKFVLKLHPTEDHTAGCAAPGAGYDAPCCLADVSAIFVEDGIRLVQLLILSVYGVFRMNRLVSQIWTHSKLLWTSPYQILRLQKTRWDPKRSSASTNGSEIFKKKSVQADCKPNSPNNQQKAKLVDLIPVL